ncbi:DNA primase [Neptunomonas marina]|uniref:DNA primase n=1 Tax=Neptunomonas marina TaxID=1815562 RepID=A0A437Q733_9GAMM|nr:DNA primase [Neptunomonas marina]RVU30334.1 DNA primase [Neptunomonas marina]
MAGRIPQNFIDDLLARVNIVDIIDGRVKLKKAGKNYSGLCPFHQEKSPSFSVSPDKQFYYCFGCGAGGNAIGFLMEYERLDFPQAVEEVAKLVGVDVPREAQIDSKTPSQRAQLDILDQVSAYYEEMLKGHSDNQRAISYLTHRGLSGKVAKFFSLGYAPPGWSNLLQRFADSNQKKALLEESGMLIHNEEKQSHYDRFRDRIMFPIRDVRGRVVAFGGRVLGDEKPKYLNSPETDTFHKSRELYGLYEARKLTQKLTRIVIVEGYMDVISLTQFGITYAVATLGTAATAQHLERLFKTVSEVIFCFDGDAAGRKAAQRALETTLPVIRDGLQARFMFLPEGEDPDSLVRSEGKEGFEARLDEALPFSEFFFKSLGDGVDMSTLDGRALMSAAALPKIQQMQNGLLQQMMLDKVCEITGLEPESISIHANLAPQTSATPDQPKQLAPKTQPPSRALSYPSKSKPQSTVSLCSHPISLLLHHPELVSKVESSEPLRVLNHTHIDTLIALIDYLKATPEASLGSLLIDWSDDPALSPLLLQLSEISRLDPILSEDANRLFDDAWERLQRDASIQSIAALQKKPFSTLSDAEKQQLRELSKLRTH